MIELLKYLANILKPEQLLEVAHIISQNPDMIDQDTFIEIVNDVNNYDMKEIGESEFRKIEKRFNEVNEIRARSEMYKILKDNNISLN